MGDYSLRLRHLQISERVMGSIYIFPDLYVCVVVGGYLLCRSPFLWFKLNCSTCEFEYCSFFPLYKYDIQFTYVLSNQYTVYRCFVALWYAYTDTAVKFIPYFRVDSRKALGFQCGWQKSAGTVVEIFFSCTNCICSNDRASANFSECQRATAAAFSGSSTPSITTSTTTASQSTIK